MMKRTHGMIKMRNGIIKRTKGIIKSTNAIKLEVKIESSSNNLLDITSKPNL